MKMRDMMTIVGLLAILGVLSEAISVENTVQFYVVSKVITYTSFTILFLCFAAAAYLYASARTVSGEVNLLGASCVLSLFLILHIANHFNVELLPGNYITTSNYTLVEKNPTPGKYPLHDVAGMRVLTYGQRIMLTDVTADNKLPNVGYTLKVSAEFTTVNVVEELPLYAQFMQNNAIVGTTVEEKLTRILTDCLDYAGSTQQSSSPESTVPVSWSVRAPMQECVTGKLIATGIHLQENKFFVM
jgi:hypothetical protein